MFTKKDINDQIKIALSNETFKSFYNKLDDKEKEDIKKRYLEGTNLYNLIFDKHKPYRMESLESSAREQLCDLLLKKGFTKVYGKKARAYTEGKAFVFKEDDYLIAIKITEYFKKGMNCSYLFFLEIPTPKGKIYADLRKGGEFSPENDLDYVAYTAHFFDRYKERLNLEGDREQVVKKFMKTELESTLKGSSLEYVDGHRVIYNIKKGLALGVGFSDIGILLKTFISENEINSFQERKKEELDQMMLLNDLEDIF